MKRLILGFMFIGFGLASIQHFSKLEGTLDDELTQRVAKEYDEQVLVSKSQTMLNKAKTKADLDAVEEAAHNLPQQYRDSIQPTLSLKRAAAIFSEAEDYFRKAIEIERAAALPPTAPMPPEYDQNQPEEIPQPQRELHPLTTKNLNKAIELYEKARKEVENLKDTGNADFDYHLNYLKGEIYYRILELVADQESAPELFNQTLTYYKYALRSRNNDMNTVINIEILIKNQNELMGNASNPQARKKQMLNSKKYGIGKSSGN